MGLAALAFIYYQAVQDYYLRHQPTSIYKAPRFLYSINGGEPSRVYNPLSVYVAFGRVFTTSGTGHIVVTDREGGYYWTLNLSGKELPMEISPRSVVLDRFGRIYVSAGPLNSILVYDYNGKFEYLFPQKLGPKKARLKLRSRKIVSPVAMSYVDNELYITDVGDQTLKILSTTGKLIKKIGGPGSTGGRFLYPNGVAKSDDGKIYIADSNNSKVQVLSESGRFLEYLKPPPEEPFSLPRGIAIDKLGRIHVVDTLKNRVLVFSGEHKFLFGYGAGQKNEGDMAYPNGIFIDRETGLIFIADRMNNRVAVWAEK